MPPAPAHVFVLMLENRSFDHLFGHCGLSGVDAETGGPTRVDGLTGEETNSLSGTAYGVSPAGADFVMPSDPGHELADVLAQLCGPDTKYTAPYPPIDMSGFVASYARTGGAAKPGEVMRCFDTARQLPVLHALASEFAICDRWFASLPGPTWPNRLFVHAASSGGLDHQPSDAEIIDFETVDGFAFPRGTVFDALAKKGRRYHVYSGDQFPMAAALKGMTLLDVHRIEDLLEALKQDSFPYDYVFIEPSYDVLLDYRGSNCQHPLGDVREGEALVKTLYEALRASSIWESSVLLVLWDEHGGFYDHVVPPPAVAPGDTKPGTGYNRTGFTFEQYGVRTPALVVSPLVPRGTIDHRVYDHSSVPATLERLFGLGPLTARDAAARDVLPLLSLDAPRQTPLTLPSPVEQDAAPPSSGQVRPGVSRPGDPAGEGLLPSIVHAAMRQHLLVDSLKKAEVLARVALVKTRADALAYLQEVSTKLKAIL